MKEEFLKACEKFGGREHAERDIELLCKGEYESISHPLFYSIELKDDKIIAKIGNKKYVWNEKNEFIEECKKMGIPESKLIDDIKKVENRTFTIVLGRYSITTDGDVVIAEIDNKTYRWLIR